MPLSCEALFRAWTAEFHVWFAAPETVMMRAEVDSPFFFEVHHANQRHPHYGRFLRLEPDKLVEISWVTGPMGTKGAETVVTMECSAAAGNTLVRLIHAGFPDQECCDRHAQAWPHVLEQLEQRYISRRQ